MMKNVISPGVDCSTLVDLLRSRALNQPGQCAYIFQMDDEAEVSMTYAELDRSARAIASQLQNEGVAGGRALLLYPPGLNYIAAFFGCLYAGVAAVPVYPPRPNRRLLRFLSILDDAQAGIALTTSPILSTMGSLVGQNERTRWLATDEISLQHADTWHEPDIGGETLAFIQYTSGSTSIPKGVMLTQSNLLNNLNLIREAFGITSESRAVIWLPPYHDMGLIGGILQPLFGGFPAYLMSPVTFLQNPYRWLQAVTRFKATTSGGPNFAYDLCVRKITPEQRATLDLSSWDVAFNGAEPIRPETLDLFGRTFESCGFRQAAFYPCYGLAEGTLFVSGGKTTAPPIIKEFRADELEKNRAIEKPLSGEKSRMLVGCGCTFGQQKILLVHPETLTEVKLGEIGEVWVSGSSIARGYWNRQEETARTFGAFLSDGGEGPFLRTGDLGFLHHSELFITGRIKDLIIIRGRNHYPQDIELTVEKCHPAIRPGCGAAFSVDIHGEERLIIVQELQREFRNHDVSEVSNAIRQAVAEDHEVQVHALVLLKPGSIPKTSSGKIQRHACRAGFLKGGMETVGQWRESDAPDTNMNFQLSIDTPLQFEKWLLDELAARFRVPAASLDPTQSLSRYALDSLNAIELAHAIEERTGVLVPMERVFEGPTIAALASEVFARRSEGASRRAAELSPLKGNSAKHPLSSGQRALWFLYQLEPGSAAYNVPAAVSVHGDLDIPALRRAFQMLVNRHMSLRTTFSTIDGEPLQQIHEQMDVCFEEVDASSWDDAIVKSYIAAEAHRPFNLETGPLMRTHLLCRSEQEHILLLNMHHIITDFWSQAVLMKDLDFLYTAERKGVPSDLPPLELHYHDYSRWQDEMLAGPGGARLRAYWQQQLGDKLPILNLRTDRHRPLVQTYCGHSQPIAVDSEIVHRLKDLSRLHDSSIFMTLLAAFQILLSRYTGQKDIVIGTPTMGRSRSKLANMVGYFVNPLSLRTQLSGNPTFNEYIRRVRETVLGAFEHQDYPFATLVEKIQPDRDPSRTPIFQVMMALQTAPSFRGQSLTPFALGQIGARIQWGGLTLESITFDQRIAQFDLTLNLGEVDDGLQGSLNYNSDLFDDATISRMAGHFQTLLKSIATHPDHRLSTLQLLSEAEERRQILEWNATREEYPTNARIHDLIDAQAQRTPDAIAAVYQDQTMTYQELRYRSNGLAAQLKSLGVGPETLVGICMESSLEMMAGIVGILKSGGAYLPLDPAYPKERLAFMMADADVHVVLTQEKFKPLLTGAAALLCLDNVSEGLTDAPINDATSENLACLLYTSGSTGQPKGVLVTHRSIVNLMTSFVRSYRAGEADRILPLTSLSSASFVGEIFPLLCVGGAVVLPDKDQTLDFLKLVRLISQHNVTIISTVPAMIHTLNAMKEELPKLRLLLSGGEALSASNIDKLFESATLVNGYGLTETTICSTYRFLDKSDLATAGAVSIGKPVMNNQVYILDEYLNCCPIGSPGELYIGGDGLARGYLNKPDLTAEKFIPHPFAQGERMYTTGDLAVWLPDGNIEFLGRQDHQVKIRGFRIDLQEIEVVLDKHPAVQESIVVTREDIPGEKHLAAYVVPRSDTGRTSQGKKMTLNAGDLLDYLREKLPDYMVPSAFIFLEEIPRLDGGKADIGKLPVPEGQRPDLKTEFVAPRSEFEEVITRIWQEALRVEKVGVHDNFFDLGGHSLLLAKVHSKIRDALKKDLSLIDLFKYPTISSLARHLSPLDGDQPSHLQKSLQQAEQRRHAKNVVGREIAIVGMTGRFPGAKSIEALWLNLKNGVESITFFSDKELDGLGVSRDLLDNPDYIKAKGIIGDIDLFDAQFFGLNPREVELMDPQHRQLLECCWEALERAGYSPETYKGRVGVYAGESMNTYLITNLLSHMKLVASLDTLQASLGNDKDPLTSRISYKLNLKGPCITIQSASSTSLVAVHVACQSLLNQECDMALAGGVSIHLPEKSGYMFHEGAITSRHGHCRAFDAQADGFVPGNGVGVVVLKRLSDALADGDNIYAVIKGSVCNNDGSEKVSFMAPSVEGQVELYTMAHAIADVAPETIGYIECHGTGTALGDPIEIESLTQAFRAGTDKKRACAIGSLKTNIGHLDTAAGVCGLIKAVLSLHHKMIPASLHFTSPNPQIDFENSPFFVNTVNREWETNGTPRRAGVTSLGMGGTNAHVILEEAPAMPSSGESRPWQLLLLSAKSDSALETQTTQLASFLQQHVDVRLADVAYTLQCGRKRFNHRRMLLCENNEETTAALETLDPSRVFTANENSGDRSVVFMFTGQGAQHVNMGKGLYETESVFRAEVDRCSEILESNLGFDIRTILYPAHESIEPMTERLRQTDVAQPALFVIEYALAALWMKWGIRPQAMIGHSLGEYVAACLAGVLTLEDALALVAARGRLMQQMPPGSMLAVPLPETDVLPLLGSDLSLAGANHPSLCVVSGPENAITRLEEKVAAKGLSCRRLHTSHAFHSQMMDPILASFTDHVSKVTLNAPKLPFISNVTGTWIRAEQATDPAYWTRQLRHAVRFADGLSELLKAPRRILLEVGPGNNLSTLAKQHPSRTSSQVVISSLRHQKERQSDEAYLLMNLGKLWLAGADIDWMAFYEREQRHRVLLPTYPFERRRYWVEPVKGDAHRQKSIGGKLKIDEWFHTPLWKQSRFAKTLETRHIGSNPPTWLIFSDALGLGSGLATRLKAEGHDVVTVSAGKQFREIARDQFEINPSESRDYESLLRAMKRDAGMVVHLWSVTDSREGNGFDRECLAYGFYSLLSLVQAVGKHSTATSLRIWAVTDQMQEVTGEEALRPEKATILGACRVIPREYPNISCHSLDVVVTLSTMGSLIDQMIQELLHPSTDPVIALRGRTRWVQGYEQIALDSGDGAISRLREGGVYLITGGLGGIGLEIAAYLARTVKARLALIGRSPFPERDLWEKRRADHGEQDAVGQQIRRLLSLEEMGAQVFVLSADVSNLDQMHLVKTRVHERFGAINGIIHAAGVPGSGIIQTKALPTAESVLAPKVLGTFNLTDVFKGDHLDFMLLCSSLTAVLGEIGQADYAAANAFLDAFASFNTSSNSIQTVSVNWDAWQTVGMAVNTPVPLELKEWRQEQLRKGILPAEGIDAFARILQSSLPQVLVSTQDLVSRMEQKGTSVSVEEPLISHDLHPRPVLSNAYAPPAGDCEKAIAKIWQEMLGIDQVGLHDNFFDLGGNSLIALRIIGRIKSELNASVSDVGLFEAPTVSSLAKIISQEKDQGPAADESRTRGEKRRSRVPRRRGIPASQESEEVPIKG